jgi:hypothetical protein
LGLGLGAWGLKKQLLADLLALAVVVVGVGGLLVACGTCGNMTFQACGLAVKWQLSVVRTEVRK